MSELPPTPQSDPELERRQAFDTVVREYLPEDLDFVTDMYFDDALGYVYGMLLEMGEDPDEILKEFGVTEETDEV